MISKEDGSVGIFRPKFASIFCADDARCNMQIVHFVPHGDDTPLKRGDVAGARDPESDGTTAPFGTGAAAPARCYKTYNRGGCSAAGGVTGQDRSDRERSGQCTTAGMSRTYWINMKYMLDEAELRRHIGPTELMQSQYRRLLELSEQDNITVQVLPLDAGVHSGVPVGFSIMQLAQPDPEVVVVEYRGGIIYIERSEVVAAYAHVFDRIRASAKGPEESLSHISRLAEFDIE
jgi:hypothetical protein